MSKKSSSNPLLQAWLVLLLAILYGGGLAFVNSTLSPIIQINKENEIKSLLPELVGQTVDTPISSETLEMPLKDGSFQHIYKVNNEAGEGIGWVIPSSALGFADTVSILVGVDNQCSQIISMQVIGQKETPGLGNLIIQPAFKNQFSGKSTNEAIEIVKRDPVKTSQVVAVTGATISSKTVARAVNEALELAKPFIAKQS